MRSLAVFLLFMLTACNFNNRASLAQKVVFDVNGRQLTAQKFAQELAYHLKDQDALSAKDPKNVAIVKANIAQEFMVQTLSEEWGKENGIILKAEDLEEQVKSIQKNYPDDLAFQQALAEEGITFKAWRERLQNTMLQKLIVRTLTGKAEPPSDADIQAYYNEHKAEFSLRESAQVRQILVATETMPNP